MYVILVSIPYLPGVLSVMQTEHSTYITIPILECVCINTILISLLPFNTLHNISIQENDDSITEQSSLINILDLQDLGILTMCHMSVYTYLGWSG